MATTKVRVKWYGDELLAKIEASTEAGLYEGASLLLEGAQARAPERTGTLRDSGYVATAERSTYKRKKGVHRKERKVPAGVALAGFAAFYAHMIERGTSKMAARPFLRPALDSFKAQVGKRIAAKMANELK